MNDTGRRKSPVGAADYAIAVSALGLTEHGVRDAVAQLMGIDLHPAYGAQEAAVGPPDRERPAEAAPPPTASQKDSELPRRTAARPRTVTTEPLWIDQIAGAASDPPTWYIAARARPLDAREAQLGAAPIETDPLIPRQLLRALLVDMLSRPRARGSYDIEDAVATLARGVPLLRLRRRQVASLQQKVCLLVDIDQSMQPFRADQAILAAACRAICLRDAFVQISTVGCPAVHAESATDDADGGLVLPPVGSTVVALTTFGLGEGSLWQPTTSVEAWIELAREIVRRDCTFIAFTPLSIVRLPPALLALVHVLPWDWAGRSGRRSGHQLAQRSLHA